MEENKEFAIEDAFKRLEEIAASLEKTEVSLKESLNLYAEGVKLVACCRENLEGVQKEIEILKEI